MCAPVSVVCVCCACERGKRKTVREERERKRSNMAKTHGEVRRNAKIDKLKISASLGDLYLPKNFVKARIRPTSRGRLSQRVKDRLAVR